MQRRILGNETLDGLGLQETGGRVDLRGIAFAADLSKLRGVRLHGVDLSGSSLGNWHVVDSEIADCVFDGADCQHWHLRRSSISDSTFDHADLRYSTLGEWSEGKGNTYLRVSFASVRLVRSSTSTATYEDCDFSNAELDRVNFWQSSLIRCRFAGPVRDVVFDGRMLGEGKPDANPMDQVDFTQAVLDGCEFRGITFESVMLPPDPALILIRNNEVLDGAIAALAKVRSDPNAPIAQIVLDHAKQLLAMGGEALLNLRDFDVSADLVVSLLREADKGS